MTCIDEDFNYLAYSPNFFPCAPFSMLKKSFSLSNFLYKNAINLKA